MRGPRNNHPVALLRPDLLPAAAFHENSAGFERLAVYIADESLNAAWVAYATDRLAAELTLAKSPTPEPEAPTCDTGRCDCVICPSGRICTCQTYDRGRQECYNPRASCNTDAPKVQ